jgi:hypothetical protein
MKKKMKRQAVVMSELKEAWPSLCATHQARALVEEDSTIVRCSFQLQMLKYAVASLQQSTGRENHEVTDSRSRECGKVPGKSETVGCFEVNSGDMRDHEIATGL